MQARLEDVARIADESVTRVEDDVTSLAARAGRHRSALDHDAEQITRLSERTTALEARVSHVESAAASATAPATASVTAPGSANVTPLTQGQPTQMRVPLSALPMQGPTVGARYTNLGLPVKGDKGCGKGLMGIVEVAARLDPQTNQFYVDGFGEPIEGVDPDDPADAFAMDVLTKATVGASKIDDREENRLAGDLEFSFCEGDDKNDRKTRMADPNTIKSRVEALNRTLVRTASTHGLSFQAVFSLMLRIFEKNVKNKTGFGKATLAFQEATQQGAVFIFNCLKNLYWHVAENNEVATYVLLFLQSGYRTTLPLMVVLHFFGEHGITSRFEAKTWDPKMSFTAKKIVTGFHSLNWDVKEFVNSTIVAVMLSDTAEEKRQIASRVYAITHRLQQVPLPLRTAAVSFVFAASDERKLLPMLMRLRREYDEYIKKPGLGLQGNYLPEFFVPYIVADQGPKQSKAIGHPVLAALVNRAERQPARRTQSPPRRFSPRFPRGQVRLAIEDQKDEVLARDSTDASVKAVLPLTKRPPQQQSRQGFRPPARGARQPEAGKPRLQPLKAGDVSRKIQKMCNFYAQGKDCPYAPNCKFLHEGSLPKDSEQRRVYCTYGVANDEDYDDMRQSLVQEGSEVPECEVHALLARFDAEDEEEATDDGETEEFDEVDDAQDFHRAYATSTELIPSVSALSVAPPMAPELSVDCNNSLDQLVEMTKKQLNGSEWS